MEGAVPDAGDAGGDNSCQASAPIEGVIPDAGDRIASNGVRNDELAGGGLITIGNGDLARKVKILGRKSWALGTA